MRVALSLLSGVALPLHSSFLSLLWEKKGVLDTSEGQSTVGTGIPDPIILDSPPDELLGRQRLQQPLSPRPFLLEALLESLNNLK